jgi:TldD protein
MNKTRRDFLKQTGLAAAAVAATSAFSPTKSYVGLLAARPVEMPPDDTIRALMMTAINTAKSAGASYSDVRIGRYRNSIVFTREQQIVNTADVDNIGAGVRALVDGTWGFGASKTLTTDGVAAAAREAVAIAKANRIARDQPVQLTPVQSYPNASWTSSFKIDPFTIPIEQRADLLLKANAEALKVKGVRFVNSGLLFVKEDRNFASTEGSVISQTIVRVAVPFTITAVAPDNSDFQTRGNVVCPLSELQAAASKRLSGPHAILHTTWACGYTWGCRNSAATSPVLRSKTWTVAADVALACLPTFSVSQPGIGSSSTNFVSHLAAVSF